MRRGLIAFGTGSVAAVAGVLASHLFKHGLPWYGVAMAALPFLGYVLGLYDRRSVMAKIFRIHMAAGRGLPRIISIDVHAHNRGDAENAVRRLMEAAKSWADSRVAAESSAEQAAIEASGEEG